MRCWVGVDLSLAGAMTVFSGRAFCYVGLLCRRTGVIQSKNMNLGWASACNIIK